MTRGEGQNQCPVSLQGLDIKPTGRCRERPPTFRIQRFDEVSSEGSQAFGGVVAYVLSDFAPDLRLSGWQIGEADCKLTTISHHTSPP